MKMIVLNGPPRSGKDTFLKLLKAVFMDDLPTDTFIPFSYKWVLCEGVAQRYNVSPQTIWDLNADTTKKDKPKKLFGGKSVRQCLIYESEEVIKKELGENGVAIKTFENLKKHVYSLNIDLEKCVLISPDGGFESEMNCAMEFFGLKRSDIMLIQFQRDGCTFDGDSRSFLSNPDMVIQNDGDKIELTSHLEYVRDFIIMYTPITRAEIKVLDNIDSSDPLGVKYENLGINYDTYRTTLSLLRKRDYIAYTPTGTPALTNEGIKALIEIRMKDTVIEPFKGEVLVEERYVVGKDLPVTVIKSKP